MRDTNAILNTRYTQSAENRFHSRYNRGRPDECWEWTHTKTNGYGVMSVCFNEAARQWNFEGAHRLAYLFEHGAIPFIEGHGLAHILHTCDNPPCVNPAHLFPGTYGDNNRDKSKKGRAPRGITHFNTTLTEEQVREVKRDPSRFTDIAKKFNVSFATVQRIKTEETWAHVAAPIVITPRSEHFRGEKHPSAKLTEEQVRAILKSDRPHTDVAREYNVLASTVFKIRARKTWKHLQP